MTDSTPDGAVIMDDRRAADRLLRRVGRRGGPWIGVLVLTGLLMAAAETLLPAALGQAFDGVLGGESRQWLVWLGILIAVLVVCDALDDVAVGFATARSTAWLRRSVLDHTLALGPRAAGRLSPGEVASRMVGNAAEAGRVAPDIIRAAVNLIPAAGSVVALALIDVWLCLTFLAGMPVLALMLRAFARDASGLAARYFAVQGRIAARLVDALAGARTIATAGTVDRETRRVLQPVPELSREGMGMWRAHIRISAQDAVVVSLLEVAVLAVAGLQLTRGRISPGDMLAASGYVLLAAGLGGAVGAVGRLARSRGAAGRVAELLSLPAPAYGGTRLPAGDGTLVFRGVTAHAGGRKVLDRLDLVVPGGALVAVVGRSGAGKSLLAALAGRLLDPDEGEVLLDGVALPTVDRQELRREVGYGFEGPMLIGESIADAIAFGGRAVTPDEVVAAARAARADDFIRRLPGGYDTRMADAPMSGGEVQRIGLARTFAHAGRVVILDDVAASLDTVTEHQIGRTLTGALADRTRLVVAHRASTAARADLVVWLEDGRVRGMAPHGELWMDPDYRASFASDPLPAGQPSLNGAAGGAG